MSAYETSGPKCFVFISANCKPFRFNTGYQQKRPENVGVYLYSDHASNSLGILHIYLDIVSCLHNTDNEIKTERQAAVTAHLS